MQLGFGEKDLRTYNLILISSGDKTCTGILSNQLQTQGGLDIFILILAYNLQFLSRFIT